MLSLSILKYKTIGLFISMFLGCRCCRHQQITKLDSQLLMAYVVSTCGKSVKDNMVWVVKGVLSGVRMCQARKEVL